MAERITPPTMRFSPDIPTRAGVSPDQYNRIGQVVVLWASLEDTMQFTLWSILGLPVADGRVLTQRTDATRKLQWLRAFSKRHCTPAQKAALDLALNEIELLQDDRNFVVHGLWFTRLDDNVAWASSIRAKGPPDEMVAENFPEARMIEICRGIVNARRTLAAWRDSLEASRGKSPEPLPPDSPSPP